MNQQKIVLWVSILASFVSFLDSSVVNVALPAIAHDFGGGLLVQQWTSDAYLITLGSLILIAGSLADLFGQQRTLQIGLYGFLAASILCAVAPNGTFLIIARALQGVAGALLVPSSLSLIIANFKGEDQAKAIGSWTAWTGISFLVGPLVGGFLIDTGSWRSIFAINVIPIAATLFLMRWIQKPEQEDRTAKIDFVGALLCSLGLAGVVYALIEEPSKSWGDPFIYTPLLFGTLLLAVFIANEYKIRYPMLPLSLFKVRNFTFGNVATFLIYGGLSIAIFLITIFTQETGGYSALYSGLSVVPVTFIMFLFSSRFGALSSRFGPRLFMTLGPIVAALGFLLIMLRIDAQVSYWSALFPGILLFGLGLSATVAPLTAAVLGGIDPSHSGIGSAINNATSRIAGLIAIAGIGIIIGPHIDLLAFKKGMGVIAALLIAGGIISWVGIRNAPQRTKQ